MRQIKLLTIFGVAPVLAFTSALTAGQSPCDTDGREVAAIKDLVSAIDVAFTAADAAALAELVTDDAIWMPPDEPLIRGRPAVEARYREVFRNLHEQFTDVRHSMEVVEVRVCGGWAMSRGRYRLVLTHPRVPQPIVITGKNVHTYLRQQDGSWLISSDIWNSDAPARRGPGQ